MARGRLFSSRRMFSSNRMIFVDPKPRRPLGPLLGLMLAFAMVFAAGVYTGRHFPQFFGSPLPAPVTAAEF